MSSETVLITEPEIWIPYCVIGFVVFLLNSCLVFKECKMRKSENITLTTKYLALWSMSSMMAGSISLLFEILMEFPGFCYVSRAASRAFIYSQPITFGFYQLSRLHYCFARTQVYSDKGYPDWLFITMFGVAIVLYVFEIIISIDHYVSSCGINYEYQSYINYQYLRDKELYQFWMSIIMGVYVIWDVTTLILYIYKIRVFTNSEHSKDDKVRNRILSILNRITIITLFYQVMSISIVIYWVLFHAEHPNRLFDTVLTCLPQLLYGYSMYIMLDHNKKSYNCFLKILYRFRLYFVCYCCCKQMIIQQWSDIQLTELTINDNERDVCPNIETTDYGTKVNDTIVNPPKIEFRGSFSANTVTSS